MLETETWGETAWLLLPSHSPASLPTGHAQTEAWETQPVGASACDKQQRKEARSEPKALTLIPSYYNQSHDLEEK